MQIPPEDKIAQPLKFEKFTINFYNTIYFCTERMNPQNVLFLASYITRRWSSINDLEIDESMDHSKLKFLDQVLMIQLCPILFVIKERAIVMMSKSLLLLHPLPHLLPSIIHLHH